MNQPPYLQADTSVGGDGTATVKPDQASRRVRRWARAALAAQVVFVLSWLVAASWQGPRYSVVRHSISDMYAETAPHAAFLIIVLTLCGATGIWFAWRSVWPALRSGGRWLAGIGSALLALSIFGLGDLLTVTERLDCRLADPGCTAAKQLSNAGGTLDNTLSTAGILLFVVGGFLLAAAMKRIPGWHPAARTARWFMALMIVFTVCDAVFPATSGLFERLLALTGATWIALLARGVIRRPAPQPATEA